MAGGSVRASLALLLACSAGATLATGAMADPPTGTRIDRAAPGLSNRDNPLHSASARPGVNRYLRCSASLGRSRAIKLLDEPFRSAEQIEAAIRFNPGVTYEDTRSANCFEEMGSVQIGYDPVVAVGAFAEFLVRDRFDKDDIAAIASLSTEDWRSPGLLPRNASEALGMCVAQARADLILALIDAAPESEAEDAALGELVPLLGPCLVEGAEARFDKGFLRALLAYGLYRTLAQMTTLRSGSAERAARR